MQETFEHNIQKQFGNFKIEPSGETWMEIEKALHPHHERRRGLLWWWVPLAGVLVTGIIIWNVYSNKAIVKNNAQINNSAIKKNSISPSHKNATVITKDSLQKLQTNKLVAGEEKCVEKNGYCEVTHHNVTVSNTAKKIKTANKVSATENNVTDKQKTPSDNFNADKKVQGNSTIKENDKEVTETSTPINHSDTIAKNGQNEKDSIQKANSSVSLTQQTANSKKSKSTKKGKWFIVGEGGSLNTNSNLLSFSKSLPQYASSPSTGVSNGNSSTQDYITGAHKGWSFALGIHRQSQISAYWSFETGLMYHYFQNKQTVGSNKDSSILANNPYYLSITNYYKAGDSNTITNYAHSIEIPLLFNYTINPKQKNKFYLQVGLEAGYMFSKKWLITDETLNSYYYHSSLLKNFQLNTLFGAGVEFKNHIQANINLRQAVTPLYTINNNKIYTNKISLQILVPVRLKNKK